VPCSSKYCSSTISSKPFAKLNDNWNKKNNEQETKSLDSFFRKSSDRLYAWIIHSSLNLPSGLPVGSPHTPPETRMPTPNTHSSHSAEPKQVHIHQHTKSEIDHINHRREVLLQNFPEDQPEGSFSNPIVIKDNNNENVSSLQRSEEAQRELVL
jgi:hypothetical protein